LVISRERRHPKEADVFGKMLKKVTYSSLALSSETLPKLEPFLGRQATNSTSKTSVALQGN